MKRSRLLCIAAILTAVACLPSREERARKIVADSARADSIKTARQDSINRATPGYVIDSILLVEETIRRFRAAVGGEPVTELAGASPSREALVRRFMKAL